MSLVSERIKELREENKFTQVEVAEKLGISVSGYRKLEYGEREPNIDIIREISSMYDVTSDYLLGLSNFKNDLDGLGISVVVAENNMNVAEFQYLNVKSEKGVDAPSTVNAYGNFLQTKGHYNKLFYEYLLDFFVQPNPNPYEDVILKKKYPIELTIEPDTINGFGVILSAKCADGYELGKIKTFTGGIGLDERFARGEAEEYIDYLKKRLHLK